MIALGIMLHDVSTPAYQLHLVQAAICECSFEEVNHSPYSLVLAPNYTYPFRNLKFHLVDPRSRVKNAYRTPPKKGVESLLKTCDIQELEVPSENRKSALRSGRSILKSDPQMAFMDYPQIVRSTNLLTAPRTSLCPNLGPPDGGQIILVKTMLILIVWVSFLLRHPVCCGFDSLGEQ